MKSPGQTKAARIAAARSVCVLVVEDDRHMLTAIGDALRFRGYDVLTARDGEEALSQIGSNGGIDAVVLDVMLPKLNGYGVCQRVRRGPRKDLPIIMTTALGQCEDEQRGIAAGVNSYIRKPFRSSELLAEIAAVCCRTYPTAGKS